MCHQSHSLYFSGAQIIFYFSALVLLSQTASDYSLINQYWHMGHEIGAHSITHRNNITYWADMSPEEWAKEMVGVRKMIGQFANIDPCEVKGIK